MPTSDLDPAIVKLCELAADVAGRTLAPVADEIDQAAAWPSASMAVLAQTGLTALHMPRRINGHEQGLLALAAVTEELAVGCSSTAMCYAMHCVASKVLEAKATPDQEERFLAPIAQGRHITSLALSEPGTGAYFFLPRVQFRSGEDSYVLSGEKSFITSGGHADSYVVSAVPPGAELDPGAFTCLAVERDAPGLEWGPEWRGFGMRGNSSRGVVLNDARVPRGNLLGAEGDQLWYVFEVIAPYFLIAMSGVYVGIARAALQSAIAHLQERRHSHTGDALSAAPPLWHDVAEAWTELEATRRLVRHAARQADAGAADAALHLFAAKARVAQMVNSVTETAMILTGGRGYGEHSAIGRLHRDARAANVMAPTSHLLKTWLGRSLLNLPLM